MNTTKQIPNQLINEKSPYLLQHVYNAVNWFPWCEEAFSKAKTENKPVFLSIGYSTCHWCHVMAHESFEDEEVAEILNRDYISIKVDREERPDIDSVYMSVCQALTGSGGWPLTIIMTPEQKPFFATTYLPKTPRWGATGLIDVLNSIMTLWKNDKNRLLEAGEEVTRFINKSSQPSEHADNTPAKDLFLTATDTLKKAFDKTWGGFSRAPKFPMPHNLIFLMRQAYFENDKELFPMIEKTLIQMYRGGIYDHIGGGFSRYSTDEKWLVPHFEKMLYDNAWMLYACLEAFQKTANPLYAKVSRGIIQYVCSLLTDEQGGFYCGQDADSEGMEGKFYTFSIEEIRQVLGEKTETFCNWFGITEVGNFEGKNIPNLIENEIYDTSNEQIKNLCEKLYKYRIKRTHLHTDDKILTSWNGLMIAALAKAYREMGDSQCLVAAKEAQMFIENSLTAVNGRLYIRYRDKEAVHDGQLDDYTFYGFGLLELYASTFDVSYLQKAVKITDKMLELFSDKVQGGFYMYAHDRDKLISRPKELYDGAIPSGNSVALYNLSVLYHLTGEIKWLDALEKHVSYLVGQIEESPANYCFSLIALQSILYPSTEIVWVTAKGDFSKEQKELQKRLMPSFHVIVKNQANEKTLSQIAPYTDDYPIPTEGSSYYVCQNGSCRKSVDNLKELYHILDNN